MPVFVTRIVHAARRRPGAAIGLALLLAVVGYWYGLGQRMPHAQPASPEAYWRQMQGKLPGGGVRRADLESTVSTMQEENRALKQTLEQQQRLMTQMEQQQRAFLTDAAAKQAAQEQRLASLAQQAAARPSRQAPPPRQAAPPPPSKPPTAPPALPRPAEVGVIKRIKSTDAGGPGPLPPTVTREETAYIAPGCHAKARVVTGVFATQTAETRPMLLSITSNLFCPAHLQGPETNPLETSVPVKGCLVLGQSTASLSEERAHVFGEKMSCIFPDKSTVEPEIKAYTTGADGSLGIPGTLERRTGAYVAGAALSSVLSGASEAAAALKRSSVITPLGGAITQQGGNPALIAPVSGFQRGSDLLARWALQQAEKLLPVLWVESGVEAKIVFQDGVALEGLPTQVVRYQER